MRMDRGQSERIKTRVSEEETLQLLNNGDRDPAKLGEKERRVCVKLQRRASGSSSSQEIRSW